MIRSVLRIITRKSPLAMWQASHVRDRLVRVHPHLKVEIEGINTAADRFLDSTLVKLGGKGAFVKELEQALLENRADLAVHSMKDVTANLPEGLEISAILPRESPGDALVSNRFAALRDLPAGSRLGTSSLRRQCQIRSVRPDLQVCDIRGNLGTRLQKLDEGRYDALILAISGLKRLALDHRINAVLDVQTMLPAIGQGALGIETRSDDGRTIGLVAPLNDSLSATCVRAERAVNRCLNGGCHAPIAAHAVLTGRVLRLAALVGRVDGSRILRAELSGFADRAEEIGEELGRRLLEQGAGRILAELQGDRGG